jgi:hypothetical protein
MNRSQAQRGWVASRLTQQLLSHRTLRHPDEGRTTEQSKEPLRNARIPRTPRPQPPPPSNQSAATRTQTARQTRRSASCRRHDKGRLCTQARPAPAAIPAPAGIQCRERTRAGNQPSMWRDVQETREDVGSSEEGAYRRGRPVAVGSGARRGAAVRRQGRKRSW